MLWKCSTQYASKFGKLSSGHRTGKCPFSFQLQRKAMPKNAQTTAQLHSSYTLVKWKWSHSVVSDSLQPHGLEPTRLLRSWDSPGKNSGVGCHFLLQGIFPTQELNLGLPHCRQTLYHLSHQGSPKKECSNYHTIALISHASKVMLKILQARLQQYVNHELPDVPAGFRKGRGTRDQIANIQWIIKKARDFQKNIYFCFIDYAKPWLCGSQ